MMKDEPSRPPPHRGRRTARGGSDRGDMAQRHRAGEHGPATEGRNLQQRFAPDRLPVVELPSRMLRLPDTFPLEHGVTRPVNAGR